MSNAETNKDNDVELSEAEVMFKKKLWDDCILSEGGVSYYYPSNKDELNNGDGTPYKERYRVAMTHGEECDTKLKFKVKTATGEIFSVASKNTGEAQLVVDELFGKGHYSVSQFLV